MPLFRHRKDNRLFQIPLVYSAASAQCNSPFHRLLKNKYSSYLQFQLNMLYIVYVTKSLKVCAKLIRFSVLSQTLVHFSMFLTIANYYPRHAPIDNTSRLSTAHQYAMASLPAVPKPILYEQNAVRPLTLPSEFPAPNL